MTWKTRVRSLLADNAAVIIVGLLVIAGVGGGLVVTAEPTTTTDHRTVTVERGIGTFEHEATVVNGGAVFETGTTLENRSTYFTSVTPILNGTFEYTYQSEYQGEIQATVNTHLVLHAVDEEKGTEYWRRTEELDVTKATLTPGKSVQSTYSVNVSAIEGELESIRSEIGASPGREEVLVVADVTIDGTSKGEEIQTTRTYQQRIEPSGDVYRVETVPTEDTDTTVQEPVTQTEDPQNRRYLGYVLIGVGGLGALGFLLVLGYAGGTDAIAPSESERERLRVERQRSEYDEWITVASLPPNIGDRTRIDVESLEGLVDVAIDTDGRVLERPDGSAYSVLDDDVLYVFTHPDVTSTFAPPRTAWNETASDDGGTDGPATQSGAVSTVEEPTFDLDGDGHRETTTEDDGEGTPHGNGSEEDQSGPDPSADSP
jgi:hypothetical protein